ncbi:putative FUN34-transmembrane protein involved in ammonia production [Gigaspora margarita]|uniref:Putative FUN34-transmembrane protein involved in ammonia production n=1 Tax=Gigaspora margarita TaxID=4874 RepID=A0A8H3X7R6_GIGMA|nr:putative FUN34-transmembrane protein involved in ammonia production [Gigaspora margarita]
MPGSQIYIHDLKDFTSRHEKVDRRSIMSMPAPKIGNPTPLGLSAFAMSTFIASLYGLGVFGIAVPNILIGVSFFTGGVTQFASGMWEYKVGNTFGGTGFSAFGGFWASLGAIYTPGFGIQEAFGIIPVAPNATINEYGLCLNNCERFDSGGALYAATNFDLFTQYHNALAVYNASWLIFTFIFTLACLRTNIGVLGAFVSLTVAFMADVIYHLNPTNTVFLKIGGFAELTTSFIVFYCLAATLLTPDLSPIRLPLYDLSKKH